MNANLDGAVEDALLTRDGNAVHIDVELVGDNLRDVVQHALAVDAAQLYRRIEEHHLVHIPLCVEDTITEARLQSRSHIAVAAVNLYAVLVVDVSHDVVAGDGVAACREDVLRDVLLVDDHWLLLIKALAHYE